MRLLTIQVVALTIAALAVPLAAAGDREIVREVAARIEEERNAGNLSGFDICLRVSGGRVTLTGYVRSFHEYQLAEAIAAETESVTAVANRLGVRMQDAPRRTRASHAGLSDSREEDQSTAAVEPSRETSWFKFNWLFDIMPSRSRGETEPQASETPPAAEESEDDSQLLVRGEVEIVRDATELLKQEQQAGNLCDFNINLHVKDGALVLTGHVSNKQQSDLAGAVVARVPGVARVNNRLMIRSGPHMQLVPPRKSKPKVVESTPLD